MADATDTTLRETQRVVGNACRFFPHLLSEEHDWIVHNKPMQPVLQKGPMCGLVALTMVARMMINAEDLPQCEAQKEQGDAGKSIPFGASSVDCHTNALLQVAKEKGFTNNGEMFDANFIAALAREHFGLDATVEDAPSTLLGFCASIGDDGYVLIPYDSSRNHEPCLMNGEKAHWAVIRGFVVRATIGNRPAELTTQVTTCESMPVAQCASASALTKVLALMKEEETTPKIFALGQHGKSRHEALWDMQDLLDSNQNLHRASIERVEGEKEYVIPNPDDLEGIRGKIIVIRAAK